MKLDKYIKQQKLTYRKAADELKVSCVTLYRWIHYGHQPRQKAMKRIREWSNDSVTANDFSS